MAAIAAIPTTVLAQQRPTDDAIGPVPGAQTVIIGTRLQVKPGVLAQNVTVFTQKHIQVINPASAQDLLARVTGTYVDQASSGGFASMYVRGAENSHLMS